MAFLVGGVLAQSKTSDSKPVGQAKTRPKVVKTVSTTSTASRTFTATAYSLRGKMANGQNVYSGAIAADPRVLPLGTVVYIEGLGTFTVKDTGGKIKGNIIDIWMPNKSNALKWGRRPVKLRIISMPSKKK